MTFIIRRVTRRAKGYIKFVGNFVTGRRKHFRTHYWPSAWYAWD